MRRNRDGSIATVVAAVFMFGGAGVIGVAIASQRGVPQVPLATNGHDSESPRVTESTASSSPVPSEPPQKGSASKSVAPVLGRSKPVALDIPSIDVHSVVNHLGQAADGSLETPLPGPDYDEAAWYKHSPTPGSLGPAILLGHVDSAANGPSVFFRLGELRKGDRASIARADGSVATFVVDSVVRYSKDDFPTETVYGDIDHSGLRIVTCGGAFDNSTGHYLDNIVVFASLVDTKL